MSPDESVSRGQKAWRQPYIEQRRHKEAQLALVTAFAQSMECRMLRLVRHFGDQEDKGDPCQTCDICLPGESVTRQTRSASDTEQRLMVSLLDELQGASSQAKGKLYRDRFEDQLTRNEFETLVEALFRAGLIEIEQDSFTKEGRVIEFQRLSITRRGYRSLRETGGASRDVEITVVQAPKRKRTARKRRASAPAGKKKKRAAPAKREPSVSDKAPSYRLVEALKAWRLGLARKRGIPAFRILTDRTIHNIASERPKTEDDLLQVSGVGETILKKHGKQILAICARVS